MKKTPRTLATLSCLALAVLLPILMTGTAAAQNLLVTNGTSTNFSSGTNSFADAYVGFTNDGIDSNSLTVANTNTFVTNSGGLTVGYSGSSNSVVITNGGKVQNTSGSVGYDTNASNNSVLVTGTNSFWMNSGVLQVGISGAGNSLVILDGGKVQNTSATIGGSNTASNNSVTVSGTNSLWTNSGGVTVGSNGVGNSLVISNGGKVQNTFGTVGFDANASNNFVLVTGTNSLWTNSTTVTVGAFGAGNSLVISNGGKVQSTTAIMGSSSTASNNSVTVSGANSFWTNSGALTLGNNGASNSLVISNGGKVQNTVGVLGTTATGSNNWVLVTGTNSLWTNSGVLSVGVLGRGNSLTISDGGTVRNAAATFIGSNSVGNSVLVTGSNSLWAISSSNTVGRSGSGNSMVISNGGKVQNAAGIIGTGGSASNSSVLVTGSNSLWTNSDSLTVGLGTTDCSLVISNGGTVRNTSGTIGSAGTFNSIGNSVLVTGTNSLWSCLTALNVGSSGSGNRLVISNGGMVQNTDGKIGNATSVSNSVLVTGANSVWSNSGFVGVGYFYGASCSLIISNGGKVQNTTATIGYDVTATNNWALVTGAGSTWSNSGTLTIGGALNGGGSGTLTVANGGLLAASDIAIASGSNSIGTLNIGRFDTNDTAGTINTATIAFGTNNTGTINFNQSDSLTLTSSISGAGKLKQLGTGMTTLTGSNSYTGTTTISAGTLLFSNATSLYRGSNSLWTAANIIVASNATAAFGVGGASSFTTSNITTLLGNLTTVNSNGLQAGSSIGFDTTAGDFTLINTIADSTGTGGGSLGLAKLGLGTMTLSGSNSYSGGTKIDGGTLRLDGVNAVGSGSVVQTTLTSSVEFLSGGRMTNNMTVFQYSFANTFEAAGQVTLADAASSITVASDKTLTGSGAFVGTGGLTKRGFGNMTLSASNNFSGPLSVEAGTLELASLTGSAAGSASSFAVANGATLLVSQSDQVNNSATVTLSGGTITRGSGVSEVFGNLNLTQASFLDFGTGAAGTMTFGTYTPSALLTINNFAQGNTLVFGSDLTSTITNSSYFSFSSGGISSSWDSGTSTFTITAIPETSTYVAALGLLALGALPLVRRKQAKVS